MNRKVAETKFNDLVRKAEEYNARPGNDKRYFPMTDGRRGRLITIGMYDYIAKKYAICDLLAHNIQTVLEDIEAMIDNPGAKKVLPVIA